MITLKQMEIVDKQKMYKIYDNWPEIGKITYEKNWKKIKFRKFDHIIFAGMGGSGTIGDIFSSIFSKTGKHITVIKGYNLPETANKKSLVIITSVSGNTSETLSILKEAQKIKSEIIVFASGGKIEKICNKKKIEFRKIEQLNSPRASLINYIFAILKILDPVLSYNKKNIEHCINNLYQIQKNISSKNLTKSNIALKYASNIKGIPLVYYPWGLHAVAIRFKNTLQENSKLHIMIEDIVEASHNGVVAWERNSNVFPILLQGFNDNIKTIERWKAIKKYFDKNGIKFLEIHSLKGDILSKILILMYILDYVTIYKAILDKVDPTPVETIKFIKLITK